MENKEIEILVKKVHNDAKIPSYAHYGDVGMDITAVSVEYDEKNDMYIYHTGLTFESDFNVGQFIFLRSSNRKTECYLTNHVGIVDCAIYRGEVLVCLKNRTSIEQMAKSIGFDAYNKAFFDAIKQNEDIMTSLLIAQNAQNEAISMIKENAKKLQYAPYQVGDKIAQMVIFNYPTVKIKEVETLSETVRGTNGFGSTGN